jgi:hypothetical protein
MYKPINQDEKITKDMIQKLDPKTLGEFIAKLANAHTFLMNPLSGLLSPEKKKEKIKKIFEPIKK